MKPSISFGLIALLATTQAFAQVPCNGGRQTIATIEGSKVQSFRKGMPSVYFRSNMDVNTDGAPRSYHPQDPRGQSLALNNIANAITSRTDRRGRAESCRPRSGTCYAQYINAFIEARDSGWATAGVPRIRTDGIIPWALNTATGRQEPCTIKSGPDQGYFVSQTSAILNSNADQCDVSRYVNAMSINAIVLPKNRAFRSQGVVADRTDSVVVRDRETGQFFFAIVGDNGPSNKLGEGSVALAAALSGYTLTGTERYPQIRRLARRDVDYLVLPTVDVLREAGGSVDSQAISRIVRSAFDRWGGEARFTACFG